jgi:hypothetical protein
MRSDRDQEIGSDQSQESRSHRLPSEWFDNAIELNRGQNICVG